MKAQFGIPGRLKDHDYVSRDDGVEKVPLSEPDPLKKMLHPEHILLDLHFRCVIACFSGFKPQTRENSDEISARSDGKIYCYIHTLTELADDVEIVSRIHVGAGSIYSNHRPYTMILDRDRSNKARMRYNWPSVEECTGFSSIWQDTSSPLTLQAFAEESDQLRFWYSIFGNGREVSFSPVQIFKAICKATAWRAFSNRSRESITSTVLLSYTYEQTCLMVCGEGKLQPGLNRENVVLRPHQGNTLGKCVVLILTRGKVWLLRNKDDLETALKIEYANRQLNEDGSNAPSLGVERLVLLS
ncbi:MAG: hypothetical protein ASARMPRED_003312 [Alectoria sarmentosa]|nr:MAG: hypothetical protein ASARMPRED_003312 [Alectoria sarmentosa]